MYDRELKRLEKQLRSFLKKLNKLEKNLDEHDRKLDRLEGYKPERPSPYDLSERKRIH